MKKNVLDLPPCSPLFWPSLSIYVDLLDGLCAYRGVNLANIAYIKEQHGGKSKTFFFILKANDSFPFTPMLFFDIARF